MTPSDFKITFVLDTYSPYRGGRETQVQLIAAVLVKLGAQVSVLTQKPPIRPGLEPLLGLFGCVTFLRNVFNRSYRATGPGGEVVHYTRLTWRERLLLVALLIPRRLLKTLPLVGNRLDASIIRRANAIQGAADLRLFTEAFATDVDIVHVHSCSSFERLALDHAVRANRRVIATPYLHPEVESGKIENVDQDLLRLFNRAKAVVALLPTDVAAMRVLGVEPEVFEWGVMTGLKPIQSPKHTTGQASDEAVVLFLGRLEQYKGFEHLLAAASLVWETLPRTRFVFAGPDHTFREGQLKRIRAFGDARVVGLGNVSEEEKARILEECTLLCLPSRSEIFPVVICEAWIHGKPVIAGPAPGLKELVEGNGGGLAVPQEAGAIAAAIVTLLKDAPRRAAMGRKGREAMTTKYSDTVLADRLVDFYCRVARDQPMKTRVAR